MRQKKREGRRGTEKGGGGICKKKTHAMLCNLVRQDPVMVKSGILGTKGLRPKVGGEKERPKKKTNANGLYVKHSRPTVGQTSL